MRQAYVIAVALLLAAVAAHGADDPRTDVHERDGVRVEVRVRSQDFTWTVTSVDAAPITGSRTRPPAGMMLIQQPGRVGANLRMR